MQPEDAKADAVEAGASSEPAPAAEGQVPSVTPPSAPPRPQVRPPVLASEALRRDLRPAAPGRKAMRVLAVVLGLAGAACLAPLIATDRTVVPVAGAFAALALLGLVPMPYPARAAAIATIGASALVVATWNRLEAAGAPESVVLDLGVSILAAGLVFRAWHRASIGARLLVAAGVAVCVGWMRLTHAFADLTILETAWQAWLPRVAPVPLALCLMLSLLAFMDAGSTGGSVTWAGALLAWYALHQWSGVLAAAWPAGEVAPLVSRIDPRVAVAGLASPLLAALLAVAIAQLLAVAASDDPAV